MLGVLHTAAEEEEKKRLQREIYFALIWWGKLFMLQKMFIAKAVISCCLMRCRGSAADNINHEPR